MDGGDDTCGFECNVCLAIAQDPVITACGHLYCWSCLMRWIFKTYSNNECPVCRSEIDLSQLIFSPDPRSGFECKICSKLALDPIVTFCGHLYCWPCLNKWLHKWNSSSNCRVCQAVIEEHNLVPIYGKGTTSNDVSDHGRSRFVPLVPADALSLHFVQHVFVIVGALFRIGRRIMVVFMTRVVPGIAIVVALHPSLPRQRKKELAEKVLVSSLCSWVVLVFWDVL